MNILQRPNQNKDKIYFHYDFGRGQGQRPSTGIFIYTKPKDQIQKNHNREALKLLEIKKSEQIIEQQAIGSAFIPAHKFKENFLDYFEEYIKLNKRDSNRHLSRCTLPDRHTRAKTGIAHHPKENRQANYTDTASNCKNYT